MIILDLEFDAMTITGDSHSQFHVLAVDDSMIDRKLIERLLKTSSYQGTKFTFLVKKGLIFMTRAVTVLFLCFVRFLFFFFLGSDCYAFRYVMAVTAVDSGSKALKFLGLHEEDDHSNPDTVPSVSPNDHRVKFLSFSLSSPCFPVFPFSMPEIPLLS